MDGFSCCDASEGYRCVAQPQLFWLARAYIDPSGAPFVCVRYLGGIWRNGGDALDHIFIDSPITQIMRIWIDTSHTIDSPITQIMRIWIDTSHTCMAN